MLTILIAAAGWAGLYAQFPMGQPVTQPVGGLGQKAIRRIVLGRGFVPRSLGFQPFVRPAITPDSWSGGSGYWSTAASWSLGAVPGSGNDASITTSSSVVQLNVNGSINNLTLGSTSVLNFNDGTSLTIGGTTMTNGGGITLSSAGDATSLIIGSSAVTLTGGGTVTLGNNSANFIYGAAGADVLTNANNTIQGSGNIGAGQMGLINQGTINANNPTPLTIWTNSGTTNTGTLEATAGGNLILESGTFTNTGGSILASGAGSVVTLLNSTIVGGTLNTVAGGVIQASGNPTLNGVTNNGTYQLPNGSDTTLVGTIFNAGNIQMNSAGSATELQISGAVALTGGATYALTMSNASSNIIAGSGPGATLTNMVLIQGSGNIGNGSMGFVNDATVIANQSTPLIIQPSSSGFNNLGELQVNAGSTLEITGPFDNFAGTTLTGGQYYVAGTLQFGASGSSITTNAADLFLAGTGALRDLGGNNLLSGFTTNATAGTFTLLAGGSYSTPGNFTNNGSMTVEQASLLTVSGNLTNGGTGTVDLDLAGSLTVSGNVNNSGQLTTNLTGEGGGANTLTVTGTLANNAGATVGIGENNNTSDVANVGQLSNAGAVTVDKGATLNLTSAGTDTNTGTIAVNNGTLSLATGADLDMEQGGKLTVTGSLTNAGAITTNEANLAGAANTISVSGKLTNTSGASLTVGANNDTADTASLGSLSNAGTVTVGAGASLKLTSAGADSNSGSILVSGGTLTLAQNSTFTNSGTLDIEGGQLDSPADAANVVNTSRSNVKDNFSTINVSGTVTNGGTIALGTSATDTYGKLVNTGTVTVGATSSLTLSSAATDTNSGSITLNGGTLTLASNSTFTNSGTLDLGDGAKLYAAKVVNTSRSNVKDNFSTVNVSGTMTNGGTITLGSSETDTYGTLVNTGAVTVGEGSSLTLSGAGANTNSGAIDVDGTLSSNGSITMSGKGTLTLAGGSVIATGLNDSMSLSPIDMISGSGAISGFSITNAGTISADQAAPLHGAFSAFLNLGDDVVTNEGKFEVSNSNTLQIGTAAGGALTNFSGTTLTGGTYNITGTLQFGASGSSIATNAANITLNGAGQIIDFGNNNMLSGFNYNASAGVFTLASGASLTTGGGSFTNAGSFTISKGTIFTVGGSSFNYTQTGGSTTVDGTLTSTSPGTLSVNGGSLDGAGTLGYNVVDDSTVTPGDSTAKTGKLAVSDTYTQGSTGALDIEINGTTAGAKYDQLKVTQAATLGGTLNIALGSSFTPTVGQTFTILTASSVTDQFATVNGLAINGSEHFTIAYNAGSVVLTVVSGPLPASSPSSSAIVTQLIHPVLYHGGHYGLGLNTPRLARVPPAGMTAPLSLRLAGTALRAFRPRDDFGATPAPVSAGDAAGAGVMGISPNSAEASNSMAAMNHMRFECGVDLKALFKTRRKQLVRALWAAPDSPEALAIGYMTYNGAH
jgi:fibronectin-binding autotransporter adhesin